MPGENEKKILPKEVRNNITRLYIIKVAKWFMLVMPVIVPFYESNGLSLHEIMVLKAIYSVSIVVLEIPSGYFADRIGRKNTLVAGSVLGTLGFGIYSFTHGFYGFVIAEIILGAGQSLISGADSAMLYDTLNSRKMSGKYSMYEGRIISLGNFAESIAGLAGGALAVISIRYPFYAQTIVALTAVPASIMLWEPERVSEIKVTMRGIVDIIRHSLVDNRKLRSNLLLSSMIGTATLTMAWFVQPLFEEAGIGLAYFGILWTALNLSVAATSYIAHRFDKIAGERLAMIIICTVIPLGFIAAGMLSGSLFMLVVLFIFYLVKGIATPVLKDYINRDTRSESRATVLSLRSFIIRINFAILAPFGGWMSDT